MNLRCLVYTSRRMGPDDGPLDDIAAVSAQNNARDGLTGAMIYDDRHFMQWLEGDLDALARCFLRIAMNPLHREIHVLLHAPTELRLFAHWSMRVFPAPGRMPSLAAQGLRLARLPEAERQASTEHLFLSLCS